VGAAVSFETILVVIEDGIARLTFNRLDKLNSFNVKMHEEVRQALSSLPTEGARVLVLTGVGRGFCAGQDLGESIDKYRKPLVLAFRRLPLPAIAAVNGVAAGAGANLALACNLVITARSASYVQAFAGLGLVPDSVGTWNHPRLVGNARGLGLTLLGRKLSAEQAAAWGMIWQCVDDAEFPSTVDALARQLAATPIRGLAVTKHAVYGSGGRTLEQQLDIERDLQRELGRSEDYAEGMAAFTEKRAPPVQGPLT
jgi:2-(1,2-epoxy-1,2-dihydrophenyl)acetyl-CoA isomerase